jgi:hypothetical protein
MATTDQMPAAPRQDLHLARLSFSEALRFRLKLGFISFGEPSGQIAMMHSELVEKHRWIDNEYFLHALNFCSCFPRPKRNSSPSTSAGSSTKFAIHRSAASGDGVNEIRFDRHAVGWKVNLRHKIGANFRECLLGTNIILSDNKDDTIHKSEGVIEHELLQLAIVGSTPEFAFQERPAYFYFAIRWVQIAVPRAPNDSARLTLDDRECAFGFEGAIEKSLKDLSLVAVAFRMLFPNLWVAGRGKKRIEILRPERAQLDEIPLQGGLKIKIHGPSRTSGCS